MRFWKTPLHVTGAELFVVTSIQCLHKDIILSDCSIQYDANWPMGFSHMDLSHTMNWDAYVIRDEFVTVRAYIHFHTHP